MDRVRCLDGIEQLADGGIHFGEAGRKVAVASATRERRTRQGRNVDERKRHVGVERLEERSGCGSVRAMGGHACVLSTCLYLGFRADREEARIRQVLCFQQSAVVRITPCSARLQPRLFAGLKPCPTTKPTCFT